MSNPPTDPQKDVLHSLFGQKRCTNNLFTKALYYFGEAIILALIFIALLILPGGILPKAIFFSLIVLGVDWTLIRWRENHPICSE